MRQRPRPSFYPKLSERSMILSARHDEFALETCQFICSLNQGRHTGNSSMSFSMRRHYQQLSFGILSQSFGSHYKTIAAKTLGV